MAKQCPEKDFYLNDSECDITFVIKGQTIPANKWLLRLKSEVFRDLLSKPHKLSSVKNLQISSTTPEAFKSMLYYLYCSELRAEDKRDYRLAIDVYQLGHKYQLNALKKSIENTIKPLMTTENIEEIYRFAKYYRLLDLIHSSNVFIDQHFNHFIVNKTSNQLNVFNEMTNGFWLQLVTKRYRNEVSVIPPKRAKVSPESKG